ncbi:MAG: recombinase family protein, partial [Oscillospiraceae bacterium]|nr:recombinase family protein [Oscillospiraceae bacterium]
MDIYTIANQMKLEHKTIHDLNLKVTFYARVSTTREEQENSVENQINYFTEMIKNNPNWTFISGYVDRIRGESAENRSEFMHMIEDGKNGEFDLILTKEVSRFARNTIDSLTYTRDLLRAGVGVFFQNDNICTIDTDSELRLTIMSSIAADEVRKLSERVRWGHKLSIESGKVLGNIRIFGYDKVDCKLIIN